MENNNLNISIVNEIKPNLFLITLVENIQGGSEAMDFSSILYELIEKNAACIIINLQNVKIMNSSGLGMLVSGLKILKQNNIKMFLVNLPTKIINLFEITHLDEVFQTYKSIDEVVNFCL